MARRRTRKDPEPIADLFGDVVQDRPSFLYSLDEGAGDAPMSLNHAQAHPPPPANENGDATDAAGKPPAAERDAASAPRPRPEEGARKRLSPFGRSPAETGPRTEPDLSADPALRPAPPAPPHGSPAAIPSAAARAARTARAEENDVVASVPTCRIHPLLSFRKLASNGADVPNAACIAAAAGAVWRGRGI